MGALKPTRRKMTAREIAARYGISERHVRNAIAEPRDDFEARALARQDQALALLEAGLTYRQVADQMGITRGSAAGLVHRARARRNNTPVNAQDALNWGRANVADGEILEVQALSVAGDDVVAYTLFGNRPTKNPQIEPYPPPPVPRNALESRAAASENW